MRKIFVGLSVGLLFILSFSVTNVFAQGTYRCNYNSDGTCGTVSNCESGYHADPNFCSQNVPTCVILQQQPRNCIKDNTDITTTCSNGGTGINTAIGCIPIDNTNALIGFILRFAVGIGGGIAFLLILVAGFQIMTSRGDPNQLKAGQELMTSAIAGLLLLIFSLVILRIIGFDILGITVFK